MGYIKRSLCCLLTLIIISVAFSCPVSAIKLTPEQSEAVSQNCSNIKQSLSKLEYADLRTRTYLGSAYEAIAGRFITPLNLRLVKNGLPSTELFKIQNDFTSAQAEFRDGYVSYMKEMEVLVAVDCTTNPQGFYDHLEVVRERRKDLQATTKKLLDLALAQYRAVFDLRSAL